MKIAEYAALRGIDYGVAHRATKAVYAQIGKKLVAGNKGTQLDDSDIALLDEYRAGASGRASARQRRFAQSFEAGREGWLQTWGDDFKDQNAEFRLWAMTVALVLRYVKTRWALNRQFRPGKSVGDLLVTVCIRAGVDAVMNGEYVGFTAWLLDNGYKPGEGA